MNVPHFVNPCRFGFILGARGGAKGSLPFPAPRADRFIVGRAKIEHARRPRLVINTTPQPWQKAAAKAKARAEKSPHLGFNDRRLAREARKAELAASQLIAARWSGKEA